MLRQKGRNVPQGAKEGDNPSRRNPTPKKKRTGTKLVPGTRSLVRVQSERKIFPRARLRSSTTSSLNVATRPAKRKKTHGREEREREERAEAEKKESHGAHGEKKKRGEVAH